MIDLKELNDTERRLIELFQSMEPPEQKLCTDLVEQMANGVLPLEKLNGSVINYGQIGCIGQTAAAVEKKFALIQEFKSEALQSFSLYQPTYSFASVDEYKATLEDVRDQHFITAWLDNVVALNVKAYTMQNPAAYIKVPKNAPRNLIKRHIITP